MRQLVQRTFKSLNNRLLSLTTRDSRRGFCKNNTTMTHDGSRAKITNLERFIDFRIFKEPNRIRKIPFRWLTKYRSDCDRRPLTSREAFFFIGTGITVAHFHCDGKVKRDASIVDVC